MVGIVVVSHSAKIADGVVELASQMAVKGQKIIAAGGMDGAIGTSAGTIMAALIQAETGAGVVVLADLGSAIMSTEAAIDLLGETARDKIRIADAPLVEGAIAAVVQASVGDSLAGVVTAAESARSISKR